MGVGWRLLGAGTCVLVLTTGLRAQTLPVPTLPAEAMPPPETPPSALPASAQPVQDQGPKRPRPWEYALGVGVGWDSNIDFLIPDGPSSTAIVPRGALARVFWSPRGQLRAEVAGRWIGYFDQKDLGRGDADMSLEGRYRSSPSTTWRGNASYTFGHSDSSEILLSQGVLLPLVKTRTLVGAFGLSQQTGPRTSLRVDGRVYRTDFDVPGLIDGESLRGTVGLEHRLGSRSTAAIEYSLEDVLSDQTGRYYLTHYGSLQWTRLLSLRSALLLEAGASYTPDPARAGLGQKEGFFGGASVNRQVKRSSLTFFVRREVAPAFGTGLSRLDSRAGLSAVIPMGRVWELRLSGSHVQPETPQGAERAYPSSDDAFIALGRRLGGKVELSGEATYRRRGATGALPSIEAFQAGLFLTLLTPSGRPSLWAGGR